jgi:hypothetical protein
MQVRRIKQCPWQAPGVQHVLPRLLLLLAAAAPVISAEH